MSLISFYFLFWFFSYFWSDNPYSIKISSWAETAGRGMWLGQWTMSQRLGIPWREKTFKQSGTGITIGVYQRLSLWEKQRLNNFEFARQWVSRAEQAKQAYRTSSRQNAKCLVPSVTFYSSYYSEFQSNVILAQNPTSSNSWLAE